MSIAEPNVTEAYAFACLNCGHGWEQSYEIAHRTDASGRPTVTYLVEGARVPSPLTRPTCGNCEGHLVRIMRAGQVSGTAARSRWAGRPNDKPKGKSTDKPKKNRTERLKGISADKRTGRRTGERFGRHTDEQTGTPIASSDSPSSDSSPSSGRPSENQPSDHRRSDNRRSDGPPSDQPLGGPVDGPAEAADSQRPRTVRGGFLHLRRRHESPGAA